VVAIAGTVIETNGKSALTPRSSECAGTLFLLPGALLRPFYTAATLASSAPLAHSAARATMRP